MSRIQVTHYPKPTRPQVTPTLPYSGFAGAKVCRPSIPRAARTPTLQAAAPRLFCLPPATCLHFYRLCLLRPYHSLHPSFRPLDGAIGRPWPALLYGDRFYTTSFETTQQYIESTDLERRVYFSPKLSASYKASRTPWTSVYRCAVKSTAQRPLGFVTSIINVIYYNHLQLKKHMAWLVPSILIQLRSYWDCVMSRQKRPDSRSRIEMRQHTNCNAPHLLRTDYMFTLLFHSLFIYFLVILMRTNQNNPIIGLLIGFIKNVPSFVAPMNRNI